LAEEEIADAIAALPARENAPPPRLHLWTDRGTITHPILNRTLEVLQNLARKARTTTPYQIIAEAIEELNIAPSSDRVTAWLPNGPSPMPNCS
jgi:exodeoxyribonuclease-5